ncbi:hypothetical protein DPMN_158808 [Dreissena polymorpha]|uniref:Uncharacterized protein n=1 Tax=Dreissena polymorpha TaxID=45954 RepID=A0A9D4EHY1_DREPO|nr:hypothetical protein DPMN_158808 [Dreissena polymorpha]
MLATVLWFLSRVEPVAYGPNAQTGVRNGIRRLQGKWPGRCWNPRSIAFRAGAQTGAQTRDLWLLVRLLNSGLQPSLTGLVVKLGPTALVLYLSANFTFKFRTDSSFYRDVQKEPI